MYMDLVELHIEKQAKRKQKEDSLARYSEEWSVKGERLRVLRRQHGLLASFIAEDIGISMSTLRKFERGIYIQRVKIIERAYERILNTKRLQDENARLLWQVRHPPAREQCIIVEVDGKRYEIPRDPNVQSQHRRTPRSII